MIKMFERLAQTKKEGLIFTAGGYRFQELEICVDRLRLHKWFKAKIIIKYKGYIVKFSPMYCWKSLENFLNM